MSENILSYLCGAQSDAASNSPQQQQCHMYAKLVENAVYFCCCWCGIASVFDASFVALWDYGSHGFDLTGVVREDGEGGVGICQWSPKMMLACVYHACVRLSPRRYLSRMTATTASSNGTKVVSNSRFVKERRSGVRFVKFIHLIASCVLHLRLRGNLHSGTADEDDRRKPGVITLIIIIIIRRFIDGLSDV